MEASYVALIHSSRVLPATRAVLLERLDASFDFYEPKVFTLGEFQTLEAMAMRLLPARAGETPLPYAAMIDSMLVQWKGNGWRYADLPPDCEAIHSGLQLLERDSMHAHSLSFAALSTEQQNQLLTELQRAPATRWPLLPAAKWFEEILALVTELFMASPETYSEIGYSGIANNPLWDWVGLDSAECWEPRPKAVR